MRVTVPATALAHAIRNPAKQARRAIPVGLLLAESSASDIADAHVVVCAREAGQPVLTSDPVDLARLAPDLRLVAV